MKPLRITAWFFFLLFCVRHSYAQGLGPSILWQKCVGGSADDKAYSITRALDGGVVVAGTSMSNDGDVTGHHGTTSTTDGWVVKLSSGGTVQWTKSIGGTGNDVLSKVVLTSDGGYICVGYTYSTDGDVSGNHGNADIWVVKLDAYGNLQWQKCLGGSANDIGYDIMQTVDGKYTLIGSTQSSDGNVTGFIGVQDAWVANLDTAGNLLWERCLGSTSLDFGYGIMAGPDGGYIASIEANGHDGTLTGLGGGQSPNGYVLELSDTATMVQGKWIGSNSYGYGSKTIDNNHFYLMSSLQYCTSNTAFQVQEFDTSFNQTGSTNTFGYCGPYSYNYFVQPGGGTMITLGNGGGVLAGATDDASTYTLKGSIDAYVANFGSHTWGKVYGGSGADFFNGIVAMNDYDFIVAGYTSSNNGDVSGNHGGNDFWVVRLSHFNTVRGTVFLDYNKNGTMDSGEPLLNDVLVQSSGGPGIVSGSSTVNGIFNNIVDTGTYSTTVISSVPYYTPVPASHSSIFTAYDTQDSFSIAMQPVPSERDYAVNLYPRSFPRAGDSINYGLLYMNKGTDTLTNRTVRLVKDHRLQYLSATPAPTTVSGDTLSWLIASLSPRDTGSITIYTKGMTPPVLGLGDTLLNTAWIDTTGDLNTANNTFALKQIILSSYDPNGKTESNEGSVDSADLAKGQYLQYTITFQNTGNDTAFNISVTDTLSSKLDVTSFEMVGASAPYQLTTRNGNILTWTFSSIRLPDSTVNEPGSQGYIVYRIRPAAGYHKGDSILNGAGIYFDFNPVVPTALQKTRILSVSPPPAPVISGLHQGYCQNAGTQTITISNMPQAQSQTTVSAFIDSTSVTVASDGTFVVQPGVLGAGGHKAVVVFSNAIGADTTTQPFLVDSAVTPKVKLSTSTDTLTDVSQQAVINATAVAGAGSNPMYTFSLDRGFASPLLGPGAASSLNLSASGLQTGNNTIYVRMVTSDTCYTVSAAIDSIVIVWKPGGDETPPAVPVIQGLADNYCSNAGNQLFTIANNPDASTTVTVTLDGQALSAGTGQSYSFAVAGLAAGTHTVVVTFTNAAGTNATSKQFSISMAVTPMVRLSSSATGVSASMPSLELRATAVSGGGNTPVFTFALDAGFTHILSGPGTVDSIPVDTSELVAGANNVYVRMQTSDSCYTTKTSLDSMVITRTASSGGGGGGGNDSDAAALRANPNPFRDRVFITGLRSSDTYSIKLLNSQGMIVGSVTVSGVTQSTFITGNMTTGIYMLRVYDETSGRVIRLVRLLAFGNN